MKVWDVGRLIFKFSKVCLKKQKPFLAWYLLGKIFDGQNLEFFKINSFYKYGEKNISNFEILVQELVLVEF